MKRKTILLLTAAAALSAILATSSVYAKSDIGSLLRHWYGNRSQQVIDPMHASAAEQRTKAAAKLNQRSEELANGSRSEISKTARARIDELTKQVQAAGNSYMDQIGAAKDGLTAGLDLQHEFDSYVDDAARTSAEELNQLAEDTINELTQQLTAAPNH
ncbi:hypothetical protein GXP70_00110 [Paenibacillus lycopersici]|uniref:Uncharacterized protein n=1 Tax=Paenibacillus lycopersici TaxID=2704462 RepID=A0A6C0G1I7_9BACL|nr:hypothetical protein [Paenibacillus lycopersici]QHT58535.1 hypothetical protein GXP70_00110 [Paenibacillus lycopersici]